MGDFKIKISDIMRYILLGCIETILCVIVVYIDAKVPDTQSLSQVIVNDFTNKPLFAILIDNSVIGLILSISIFYILGYITQLIIRLFFRGNLMGTGIGEIACFIKYFPINFLNKAKYSYPDWIYYSKAPDRVVETFQEILETEPDSESKLEFSYAKQLFQGIAFSLLIFSIIIAFCGLTETWQRITYISCAVVFTLSFLVLEYKATDARRWVRANKWSMFLVPLATCILLSILKSFQIGALVSSIMFVSLLIAAGLSRKQIRRIDIFSNRKDDKLFDKILVRFGIPRVYILTRVDDSACPYLKEQLDSIAAQDYPNIKTIILLDDKNVNPTNTKSIETIIADHQKGDLKIQYSRSKGTGAAALAHEIRQVFINYATDSDISICLDADDKLSSKETVSRIVSKMCKANANICLLRFETFGNTNTNFAKNYHNDLVKMLAKNVQIKENEVTIAHYDDTVERRRPISPEMLVTTKNAHLISTLGWVKCYRKEIAKDYQKLLNQQKCDFIKYNKYEDFPDIMALLSDSSRICAVAETSILFRKRDDSVTAMPSAINYNRYIPYYLTLTSKIAQITESKNKDSIVRYIREYFIPYKFVQYLNVVYLKTVVNEDLPYFSCEKFYENFATFYDNELDTFLRGIIKIINQNRKTKIFDDFPDNLTDKLKIRDLFDSEISEVLGFYGIKI